MNQLRKQLEAARSQYRGLRYPGDLASNILQPARGRKLWPVIGGAIAAAAAIALAVWLQRPERSADIAEHSELAGDVSFADLPVASLAELPTGLEFSPPAYDFFITTPSFSLAAEEESTEPSTTQETT